MLERQTVGEPLVPCQLRGPQRLAAGDKTRSGPQTGRLATSPLPSGVPKALERGTQLEVAHKWVDWLYQVGPRWVHAHT